MDAEKFCVQRNYDSKLFPFKIRRPATAGETPTPSSENKVRAPPPLKVRKKLVDPPSKDHFVLISS